jgi:hypothetical protein
MIAGFSRSRVIWGGLPGSRHGNGPTRLSSSRKMVDFGGHRLHIDCVGQGSQTVIWSLDWAPCRPTGPTCSRSREDHARVRLRPGGYRLE